MMLFDEDPVVNLTAIMDQMLVGYDKRLRPNYGVDPVTLGISMYVVSTDELSEKNMDFTMTAYFRQFWHDPRLAFERRPNLNKLVVGPEFLSKIWKPDTFFVNTKSVEKQDIPAESTFGRIMHSGDVLWSSRLTFKATCPMDLTHYPADNQLCTLEIESFGYTMSDIRFRWEDGERSFQMSPDVSLPQFNVLGYRQRIVEASLSSGNYSRLLADIAFQRASGYFTMQVYLPAGLLTVIAYFSFFISRKQVFCRVFLSTVSVLALLFMMISLNANVAKISYIKAMDHFLISCITMSLICFLESILVCWMEQGEEEKGYNRCEMGGVARGIDVLFRIGMLISYISYFSTLRMESQKTVDDLISLS